MNLEKAQSGVAMGIQGTRAKTSAVKNWDSLPELAHTIMQSFQCLKQIMCWPTNILQPGSSWLEHKDGHLQVRESLTCNNR